MGQLLLVRHGQASWDADDYDVLSPTGWEQGRALGRAWSDRGLRPDAVVRGGLRRHRETAQALLESFDGLDAAVDDGWDEFDHVAVLAGALVPPAALPTDKREYQAVLEQAIDTWMQDDGDYAEPFAAFTARVGEALRRTPSEGTVAVVTSGGAIAWVAASLLADGEPTLAARLWRRLNVVCVNASVTKVVRGQRGSTLVSFNDHTHLEAEGLLTYR